MWILNSYHYLIKGRITLESKYRGHNYHYKGYDYEILWLESFHCVVICKGYEICAGTSIKRAKEKFEALIDSGLIIKNPRIIGE